MYTTQQADLFNQSASPESQITCTGRVVELPPRSIEDDGLSALRRIRETTTANIRNLQSQLENQRKDEKFFKEFIYFAESGWHFHLLELLEKEKLRVDKLKDEMPELESMLEQLRDEARTQGENALKRFVALFPAACSNAGIELDKDCRHPKYTFNDRFLTLELNDKRDEVTLFTLEGRIGRMPADIPALVGWLKKERTRLFERKFDGPKFLKTVRKAYKDILVKEKRLDGDSVPVRDVLRKLNGRRTDELNVDLSRLARLNPQPSVERRSIDFQQSKDTEKGMLLWKSTGGYIGFITFKAERKPEEQS